MATYVRVLLHKRTIIFVSLCLLTFFAADPPDTREFVPLWFDILLWPVAFGIYLVVYHIPLLAAAALSSRIKTVRIPLPLIGAIALVPTVLICEQAVIWASDGKYNKGIFPQIIFFFLAVQALETIFFKFIMPIVREKLNEQDPSRQLVIGGEVYDLSKLLHIEAREHHVHLTFENTCLLSRARLRDIVAQTRAEDGIQPHRSWWVARDSTLMPERKDGRMILRMKDNTEVPVARTRVTDVEKWLDQHHPPDQKRRVS